MKYIALYNAIPALRKLAAAEGLPAGQLIALIRLTDQTEQAVRIFRVASAKVYRECGEGDGSSYRVTPGKEQELADRLRETGEAEAEGIREIPLDYRESMRLSVNDVAALRGIVHLNFEEGEEDDEKH